MKLYANAPGFVAISIGELDAASHDPGIISLRSLFQNNNSQWKRINEAQAKREANRAAVSSIRGKGDDEGPTTSVSEATRIRAELFARNNEIIAARLKAEQEERAAVNSLLAAIADHPVKESVADWADRMNAKDDDDDAAQAA